VSCVTVKATNNRSKEKRVNVNDVLNKYEIYLYSSRITINTVHYEIHIHTLHYGIGINFNTLHCICTAVAQSVVIPRLPFTVADRPTERAIALVASHIRVSPLI